MELKAVLVEDEPNNLLLLKDLLATHAGFVSVVGTAGSVDAAVELIRSAEPDIVLLDIEIKGGSGFDVLQKLGKYTFEVIFITAFAQYAIDAIKRRAFDYLLKPVKTSELMEALTSCSEKIAEKNDLASPKPEVPAEKYLMYKSTDGHEAILFDDILYFKANGAYTEIVLKKQLKIISRNIGELEEMLPSKFFFRTHHSFIVNANHIQRMELKRSGFIELNDGALIPVSQRKKKDFVDFMKALK